MLRDWRKMMLVGGSLNYRDSFITHSHEVKQYNLSIPSVLVMSQMSDVFWFTWGKLVVSLQHHCQHSHSQWIINVYMCICHIILINLKWLSSLLCNTLPVNLIWAPFKLLPSCSREMMSPYVGKLLSSSQTWVCFSSKAKGLHEPVNSFFFFSPFWNLLF